ncbi:MAG: ArsR family transcriptional regulator [delta proteobacterium ML8_D]|nr:MAG: ArsR family transcriptional regulator [delta proteobacterium ML8_D]
MKQKRILIIEDEKDIAELISYNLKRARFDTLILASGHKIISQAREYKPNLILLDLMLPDLDGLEVCKQLKKDKELSNVPVIMVTAMGGETDRILGLELGADDYIVKPFSPRELVLRVKAVLLRVYPDETAVTDKILQIGPVELDSLKHLVHVDRTRLKLTMTEFRLLHELMSHAGMVRTREILLENVWGYSFSGYDRTIDTHVRRLRKKLGTASSYIETVRGLGYLFKEGI